MRSSNSSTARLILALLAAFILPAVACNLPVAPAANPDVEQAVQQTLEAELFPSPAPGGPLPDQPQQPPAPTGTAFPGLPIVTVSPQPTPDFGDPQPLGDVYNYITRSGDTADGLAGRFNVAPEEIITLAEYSPSAYLPVGLAVAIPNRLSGIDMPYTGALLPDSEIVYSPTSADFSVEETVQAAGGFLASYTEELDGETLTGAQIIQRVANETSTNPRLLLGVLEYQAGWVWGQPADPGAISHPIGFYANQYNGLYKEMILVARQFTVAYYGWRSGKVTELEFAKGARVRLNPTLNAGTVSIQNLFSKLYDPAHLHDVLYGADSFAYRYHSRFGDPWQRAASVEPILPDDLEQPVLELPFAPGERWSFTGGPHAAWGVGSPWGGLDFAPAAVESGCGTSAYWITASAAGQVVRVDEGLLILDLEMDGKEQVGWAILYLHIAAADRVAVGSRVNVDDPIGHPSCEGGVSTGTHMHIVRKYNGEWLPADGPVPFVLSGWRVWQGTRAYAGTMTKGDQIVTSRPDGSHTSIITR